MKRTKHILADDGERRVEIIIKQDQKADWESETVKNKFVDLEDELFKMLLDNRFHHSDIRIIKSR